MVHSPKCILLQSNVHSCLLPAEIPIFALGVAIHVYVERKKDFTYYHIPCIIVVVPGLLYMSWMYVCVFENKVFVNLGDRQSVGVQPWCLLTGPEAFWVVKLTSSYFQLT